MAMSDGKNERKGWILQMNRCRRIKLVIITEESCRWVVVSKVASTEGTKGRVVSIVS